jgi:hypothetical protein
MRELILNNFLKKYLSAAETNAQYITGTHYMKLQMLLSKHIDAYLSAPSTSNRSVKVLEE